MQGKEGIFPAEGERPAAKKNLSGETILQADLHTRESYYILTP